MRLDWWLSCVCRSLHMRLRSLFKYFDNARWAEAFLNGELRFSSLAAFWRIEDGGVRGDPEEGRTIYRPRSGLTITNKTQGWTRTLPLTLASAVRRADEVFVFCLSQSFNPELWREFNATTCVEVLDIPAFCSRIEAAMPPGATFPGKPGHTRIGHKVEYVRAADTLGTRWALPDKIATAKAIRYARQREFRLVFSLTNALDFEEVDLNLVQNGASLALPAQNKEIAHVQIAAGSLRDICRTRL
jgi:hypothetical protein